MTKIFEKSAFWMAVPRDIHCVAVIGAGAMGGGIAAQFANAGVKVILLDMAAPEGQPHDAPARAGLERQIKIKGFMGQTGPQNVITGNLRDDLALLTQADWIIEAIVERLDIKRDLYAKVDQVRKPGSIVSSNTSTLLHSQLTQGASQSFAQDFFITHFFNPPRVMPLLEIVSNPQSDREKLARIQKAARDVLGKTVINCRDRPGFIANRIGCFWMAAAAVIAREQDITIEEADAVHQAFGVPKTGVFGLFDLIGIDLVPQVWRSLVENLPKTDRFADYDIASDPMFEQLLSAKRFGRKSGAGFFRKSELGTQACDLMSLAWRPAHNLPLTDLPGRGRDLGALFNDPGKFGRYARRVLAEVVCYAAKHGPDIAADPLDIDTAMRLGYAWREGPFTLADRVGLDVMEGALHEAGLATPDLLRQAREHGGFYAYSQKRGLRSDRNPLNLTQLKAKNNIILANDAACLVEAGNGIAVLEITTKMNAIQPEVLDIIEASLPLMGNKVKGLIIANDDPRAFCAGADLRFILDMIDHNEMEELQAFIARGQAAYLGLRYAPVPVIAAVHGFALGGGCELALHADFIIAHAEAKFGLPETSVGLIPAWGGATTLYARGLERGLSPEAAAEHAAQVIAHARQTGSAEEALDWGILGAKDRLVMHREALLPEAIQMMKTIIAKGYQSPQALTLPIAAAPDLSPIAAKGTAYDQSIMQRLSLVYTATEPRSDRDTMKVEQEVLFQLIACPATRARMAYFLQTGKPLRN